MTAILVERDADLAEVERSLIQARRIAIDIESNGLFKYRASLCTLQLGNGPTVYVVDTLATSVKGFGKLLGALGPQKIVHDIAFDARILAESGVILGNVLDTSLAARMLGRTATGLASLLQSELGLTVDKKLQHHDWTVRPLRREELTYLEGDVIHLDALADKLWAEAEERGITREIEEETRYRLSTAAASIQVVDERPPYVRMKGIDRVPAAELPILRRLADLREQKAQELDVPPYKVIGPDVLFAIARAKPKSVDELANVKGAISGSRTRGLAGAFINAVAAGITDGDVPEAERVFFERPRIPHAEVKARRAREGRLSTWRKAAAKTRLVDEQVVLPGHCLQDLADLDEPSEDAIAGIPGIGTFRVERDGAALLEALRGP